MSPKQVPPNNDPLARMTAMQEANARQKASIDRLMAERTVMLDLLFELWNEVEMPRQAGRIHSLLKEGGYDVPK